jgi:hypothetical protein
LEKGKDDKEGARERLREAGKAEREAAAAAHAAAEEHEVARQLALLREARRNRTPDQLEDDDGGDTPQELEAKLLAAARRKARGQMRREAQGPAPFGVLACRALTLELALQGDKAVVLAAAAAKAKGAKADDARRWRLVGGCLEHCSGLVLAVVHHGDETPGGNAMQGQGKAVVSTGPELVVGAKHLVGAKQTWALAESGALTNGGLRLVAGAAPGAACALAPPLGEVAAEQKWSFTKERATDVPVLVHATKAPIRA